MERFQRSPAGLCSITLVAACGGGGAANSLGAMTVGTPLPLPVVVIDADTPEVTDGVNTARQIGRNAPRDLPGFAAFGGDGGGNPLFYEADNSEILA